MNKIFSKIAKRTFSINYSNAIYKLDQVNISTPEFKVDSNIDYARKQIYWRIRNIGQREIEMLVLSWYENKKNKLSMEQLIEFNEEVINMDLPEMNNYFIKLDVIPDELKFTSEILNYSKVNPMNVQI